MGHDMDATRRRCPPRVVALGMLVLMAAACGEGDRVGPSTGVETVGGPDLASTATQPGIVFSSANLTLSQINSVHTGLVYTATPSGLLTFLSQLRAKGGRVLIKLAGPETTYKNPDGTFNLTKWKAGVDRFRNIDFSSYIADGTIVGHYIIDEPNFPSRWGNTVIPQATVEAAAQYSKQRWSSLPTIVDAPASWLASVPVTYVYLDAAWAMFRSKNGNAGSWVAGQTSRAKAKGLGLVAGLNVLDGGDGTSGIRGTQPNTWAMSAAELKQYGTGLLSQSYVCAFSMWRYSDTYYNRADVKTAMGTLSQLAKSHAKTSCRQ